ncbi:hypothetical protein Y88_2346 [Novosphingobium nitrogenifigens DSM 19370]|uniref:Cell division protein n=1 Tax=Novosphingobium nitrogenifigens DSM 19370 TaxID=983920 RepID=F1Z6C4_9SPHN|nr:hypothetical protein [Novosphingobium nitrogenifigens]EGD59906.1 hypothetical protein Y88_2346 [Novosphingobium nitrogenifigens DSM 19370]
MNASALFGSRRNVDGSDARILPEPRLTGPMPWVIAIVIALMVIAAASGLALRNAAVAADADLSGGVTVQIVSAAPAERNRQADAAVAALGKVPGVTQVRRVAQDELNSLLEPWLGTRPGDEVEDMPIPALIDLHLSGSATPQELDRLHRAIAAAAPAARVDAQQAWLAPVFRAIVALQWLSGGLITLLAVATVATVVLSVRNALGNHRTTIEIVHMLGGTDAQIAGVFQRAAATDAAAGGIIGGAVGLTAIFILAHEFAGLGSGMVTGATLRWLDWGVIAAIPLGGVALALLTARLTVLAALRRIL